MAFLFVEAGIMNGFLLHHVRGHYLTVKIRVVSVGSSGHLDSCHESRALAHRQEREESAVEVILRETRRSHQEVQQTAVEISITVHRNGKSNDAAFFAVDVMASLHPQEDPALALQHPSQLTSRYRLHTEISTTRSLSVVSQGATSQERQPWAASRRLSRSSSMVSPWLQQPGMAGISAQKPPSSVS